MIIDNWLNSLRGIATRAFSHRARSARRSLRRVTQRRAIARQVNFSGFTNSESLEVRTMLAATLNPGNLAVVGYNADTNDFVMVALTDVPASSTVFFTDRGWGDGDFHLDVGENALETTSTWVTPASDIPAGTLIRIDRDGPSFLDGASAGILTGSGTFDTSSGDQVLIYQTDDDNPASAPVFITAFNGNDEAGFGGTDLDADGWQDTGGDTGNQNSNLPAGLTADLTAYGIAGQIAGGEVDNFVYNGPVTSASPSVWLARIGNAANWTSDNGGINTGGYDFSGAAGSLPAPPNTLAVEAIPETILVTTEIDENDGTIDTGSGAGTSLREAVIAANLSPDANTITFDASLDGTDIALTLSGSNEDVSATGDLDITSEITIVGNGAVNTVIDAGGDGGLGDRVLDVLSGGTLTLEGVTVTGGRVGNLFGGGIRVQASGTAEISGSAIAGNRSASASGGGISNEGVLTLTGSAVTGNLAGVAGGGLFTNGSSVTNVVNSTFSGNSVFSNVGGGVRRFGGTVTITNSTITENTNAIGFGSGVAGTGVTLNNTIVAGNTFGGSPDDLGGTFTGSNNLIGDGQLRGLDAHTNLTGDPMLGALQDNGGPTLTHALLAGSPAIDAGSDALAVDGDMNPLTTDQRGVGFDRVSNGIVDIGAFELQNASNDAPVVVLGTGEVSHAAAFTVNGLAANDRFSQNAVAGAGDVNGDGVADVIVGAVVGNGGTGQATVFSGVDGSVIHTLDGVADDDRFGVSVAGVGDLNGDGFDDVIIGAENITANGNAISGQATVFSGATGQPLPGFTFDGGAAREYFGHSVESAGDVNGDGIDDIVVGGRGQVFGPTPSVVRVFSGADASLLHTFNQDDFGDEFGRSVSSAGDVNGDGFDDVIVGAQSDDNNGTFSGSARVFSGQTGGILFTVDGDAAADRLGRSVASAGDINGDGFDDVLVGAYFNDSNGYNSGSVRIYRGGADGDAMRGTLLRQISGDVANNALGFSVSSLGDIDGDGIPDILAGSFESGNGRARIFSGADGSEVQSFMGDDANDLFGRTVSSAGDLNGDGFDDFIVGAYGDDNNGTDSGSARVFKSSIATDGPVEYTEDDAATPVIDNIVIVDDDDTMLTQAVVQITGNYLDSEDVLAVSGMLPMGISAGAFDAGSGSITLSGTATIANYITALKLVTYENTTASSTLDRTVTVSVSDANTVMDPAGVMTGMATRDIEVTAVNDAPVVDDQAFGIAENSADTTVVGTVVATDEEDDALSYAITLGNGTGGGAFAIDNSGVITVADASQLDFETTPTFTLTVEVTDDGSPQESNTATITINLADVDEVNDSPVIVLGTVSHAAAFTLDGFATDDFFGHSVSSAGDVNGDGFDDLIVGAYRNDDNGTYSGRASVFSGRDGSPLFVFSGDDEVDLFAFSVSGAGDFNGDGFDDLIVGAYQDDNNGTESGSARVFSGFDGTELFTFNGRDAVDLFGYSVSGAGDVNGDGFDDVIVGARNDDNTAGTRVFSGADGTELFVFDGDDPNDFFGASVSGAGDVNGDGFDDLIVGAPFDDDSGTYAGSARVFSGYDGTVLFRFDGDDASDRLGTSVSGAGDVNGDGFDDLIVGVPEDDTIGGAFSGSARVFSGVDGTVLFNFSGDSSGDDFGQSVSGAGDVNGDGFDDLIVGAYRDDNNVNNSGSARVFSGADGTTLFTFDGDFADDQFGRSVSGAGDINGDGIADFFVGARRAGTGGQARAFSSSVTPDPAVQYTEDDAPVAVVDNIAIADDDDTMLTQAVVQITGNYLGSEDVLAVSGMLPMGISAGAFNTVNGSITLTGTATIADYITALKLVTYENTTASNTLDRTVTVSVSDANAVMDPAGIMTGMATRDIEVTAANDAPVVDDQAFGIAENSADTTVVGTVVATDEEDDTLSYAIEAGNGTGGGAFAIDNSGVITVADASQLDFETTPTFTLTVEVTDDGSPQESNTATVTINLADVDEVNDSPVVVLGTVSHAAAFTLDGASTRDYFGHSVSILGDIDGDGFDDLIVSAIGDGPSGRVRVFSGYDQTQLFSFNSTSSGDRFGESVGDAGDVNGDGIADIIVGDGGDDSSGESAGRVRVFSGADGTLLFSADGDSPRDSFGESVSGAGDVNGDGFDDFIIGASSDDNNGSSSGSARVFSGYDGTELFTFDGDDDYDRFGSAVSGAGDVNGDGFADLVVGAFRDETNGTESGSARVFSGFDGTVLFTFNGDDANDLFGFSVAGAGDVNGDGFDDIIVGAFRDDNTGVDTGSARVFSGYDGSVLFTFDGESDDDRFGRSVSGAGDVNGDGFDDVIVGAEGVDTNGDFSGNARVFSGADGTVLASFDGELLDGLFGNSVSGAGDINGDGFADLFVGAKQANNIGQATAFFSSVTPDPAVRYTEDDAATPIVNNIAIADDDDTMLTQAVVQITGNYLDTEDVLAIAGMLPSGISAGTFNTGNGSITLTGTATIAEYITALKLVTYENTTANSTATRTVTVSVTDANTVMDPAGVMTGMATRNIEVTAKPDFGDAPFQTLVANDGARHERGTGLYLGSGSDGEDDGVPTAAADGDDTDASGDDEDGIRFLTAVARRQAAFIEATTSGAGTLVGWIDFNQNSMFEESERRVWSVSTGVNTVSFATPADATLGDTYARFRLSTDRASALSPIGSAPDGEVEDYLVTVVGTQRELGDAPESYGTEFPGGAYHNLGRNEHWLGASRDLEEVAGTSPNADGDVDNGVEFLTPIARSQPTYARVMASAAGELSWWIDFDGSGTFDASERFSKTLRAGNNRIVFITPENASLGDTFVRFRFSSESVTEPTGRARDGEVEDYAVTILDTQREFGDAPESYSTNFPGGAYHNLGQGQHWLGANLDLEAVATPSAAADGDDLTDTDDENGVVFNSLITVGQTTQATVNASAAGELAWWIDFDQSGTFDANERFAQSLITGDNTINIVTPLDALPGSTFARFRFSSEAASVVDPVGAARDGEVEDYQVTIEATPGFQAADSLFGDEDELNSLLTSL